MQYNRNTRKTTLTRSDIRLLDRAVSLLDDIGRIVEIPDASRAAAHINLTLMKMGVKEQDVEPV